MTQPETLAGFSKIDITPLLDNHVVFGLGYWFERRVRFTGVRDPLFVRTLALGDGPSCQLIISVDAIYDSFGFAQIAVERIAHELAIPSKQVFVTCTHTHSAPITDPTDTRCDAEYGSFVADRIVESAIAAFERRQQVEIRLSSGKVPNAVRNRRPLLKTGKIAELHVPLNPDDVANFGQVDNTMTVLNFFDLQGNLAGAICHFGVHGVCIQCSQLISSDCMGRAIQRAETETSANIVILHLNGPCGDIDPIGMGSVAALDSVSERLFAGFKAVSATIVRPLFATPQYVVNGTFHARRRPTRPNEVLLAQEREMQTSTVPGDLSHHSGVGYERFLLQEERALSTMPVEFDIPYQVLRAGDLVLVGVAGEIFTNCGLKLRSLANRPVILPVGITGGWRGYLPPEDAYSQGGYEVSRARWCLIAPGETERLFAQVERDVRVAVQGKHA